MSTDVPEPFQPLLVDGNHAEVIQRVSRTGPDALDFLGDQLRTRIDDDDNIWLDRVQPVDQGLGQAFTPRVGVAVRHRKEPTSGAGRVPNCNFIQVGLRLGPPL